MSEIINEGIQDFDFSDLIQAATDSKVVTPAKDTVIIPDSDTIDDDDADVNQDIDPSEEPKTQDTVDEPSEGSDEAIVNYYEFLKEQEFLELPEDYEFDGTPEGLKKALEENKKAVYEKTARAFYEALPEEFKPAMDYALNGGTKIEEFLKMNSTQEFETLNPENVEDQKRLLFLNFKETYPKYDNDRINRMISKFDEDELEQAAKEAFADLLDAKQERIDRALQEQEAQRIANQKASEQRATALRDAIEKTDFVEKGIKDAVKGMFFNRLNVGGRETTEFEYFIQNVFQKPEHLAQLGAFFKDYDVNNGFSTKRLEQKGARKANDNFRTLITKHLGSGKPKNSHLDQHGSKAQDDNAILEAFLQYS